jgi:hypothetical protein
VIVLTAVTAVVSAVMWPGLMNLNTLSDYASARTADFWDWDSAIWSAMWRVVYLIGLRSPGWLFAAVVMMLVTGIYLILRGRLSRPWALAGAALTFAFPPVLNFGLVIGTGTWFLASIACAFGFTVRCARTQGLDRNISAVLAIAFAFLAQAARPTAAAAVLPLVIALAFTMLGPELKSWRRVLVAGAVGVAGTILLTGTVLVVQRSVLHARVSHPEQATYEYDLVSLSIDRHRVMLPADIYPRQDIAYLERFAAAPDGFLNIDPLLYGPGAALAVPPLDSEEFDSLQRAWLTSIRDHPSEYLRDRVHSTLWQLGILGPELSVYYDAPSPAWGFGTGPFPSLKSRVVAYTTIGVRTSDGSGGPMQTVWVYLVVLVAFAGFGFRSRRRSDVVLALLSVAVLLYTAGVMFASPAVTYRYMHPAVTIGTALFLLSVVVAGEWLSSRVLRVRERTLR